MPKLRVLLDTNVWSRVVVRGNQYQLIKLFRAEKTDIVMPPATLLEVLRTDNPQTRKDVTKLVCRRAWRRLHTEAQAEAAELVGEIRRLRPQWVREQPELSEIADLERFWRRDIYDLALAKDAVRQLNLVVGARERKEIANLQSFQQQRLQANGFFRSVEEAEKQLPTLTVAPDPLAWRNAEADGWEPGASVSPWRPDLLGVLWKALVLEPVRVHFTGQAATYADWTRPYVELAAVCANRRSFGHLLLYEVEQKNMPRFWLRNSVALVQHSMKLGRGNPVDAQLASYLFDADVFLTNDKRFARILNAVRASAETPYADVKYVDIHGMGDDAVAAIKSVIVGS